MKLIRQLLVTLLAVIATSTFANPPALQVDLTLNNPESDGGNVYATVTITNNDKKPQKILRWFTNLEEEHLFKVTRDGIDIAYEGPHYKRQAPVDKDYVKLSPGDSLQQTFELSAFYNMSQEGLYQISYDVKSFQLHGQQGNGKAQGQQKVERLASEVANVYLKGVADNGTARKGKPGGGGSTDCVNGTCFTGRCDNTQKNSILSALSAADGITNDSVAYLASHSANNVSARYTTWFGNVTSARYNRAVSHFDAINDAIDNQSLTFDCSCKQSYFAYVYPNQPYKVYLCRAFWSAKETGTDSRAGTIVHELSHFNVVAGTDDVVYGQSGAKNLAISDPDQALNNADSHEYFAENTPKQN